MSSSRKTLETYSAASVWNLVVTYLLLVTGMYSHKQTLGASGDKSSDSLNNGCLSVVARTSPANTTLVLYLANCGSQAGFPNRCLLERSD
jgi:hypothetical protein